MHAHNRTLIAKLGFADNDKKLPRHDLACQYLGQPEQARKVLRVVRPDIEDSAPRMSTWEQFVVLAGEKGVKVVCADDGYPQSIEGKLVDAWVKVGTERFASEIASVANGQPKKVRVPRIVVDIDPPIFEQMLNKGDGKFGTTVGFLDVVLGYSILDVQEATAVESTRARARFAAAWLARQSDDEKTLGSGASVERYEPPSPVVHFESTGGARTIGSVVVEVKIQPVGLGDLLRQFAFYRQYVGQPVMAWVAATDYDMPREDVRTLNGAGISHVRLGAGFNEYVKRRQESADVPSESTEI